MRASRRALIAIAATGISVCISGGIAEWAYAAASVPQATRPAATAFSTVGALNGVAAVSKGSAWAVGYAGKDSAPRILLLHWNGTAWSRVTRPSVLTATGQLSAVTAVSAKDAWAVGDTGRVGTGENHSLFLTGNYPHSAGSSQPPSAAWLRGLCVTWGDYVRWRDTPDGCR